MGVSKLPKVKELSEEYATVLEQKKSLYAQYRLSREEMREYQKALHNTEVFFDMDRIGERDDLRGLGICPNKQNPFRCYLNTACDYYASCYFVRADLKAIKN